MSYFVLATKSISPDATDAPRPFQWFNTNWLSTQTRAPSSDVALNRYVPVVGASTCPSHSAANIAGAIPLAGLCPAFQWKSTVESTRVEVVPVKSTLFQKVAVSPSPGGVASGEYEDSADASYARTR